MKYRPVEYSIGERNVSSRTEYGIMGKWKWNRRATAFLNSPTLSCLIFLNFSIFFVFSAKSSKSRFLRLVLQLKSLLSRSVTRTMATT